MTVTIKDALAKARAAQTAGNLQEAERLYAAILRVEPAQADANHGMERWRSLLARWWRLCLSSAPL